MNILIINKLLKDIWIAALNISEPFSEAELMDDI